MALRDSKRQARRDLHGKMQIPAFYYRTPDSAGVLIHVRLFNRFNEVGDIKGSRTYPAETENVSPKIVFNLVEVAAEALVLARTAILSFELSEAYSLDNSIPVDGEFQTWWATRLDADDASNYTFPPEGTV